MHMLLGATVSLAMFALLYIAVSVVVCGTWKLAAAACARRSPSFTAGILFAVRVLPFFAAMAITLTVTLPSFLLLEPSATDEPIGAAPFVLGWLPGAADFWSCASPAVATQNVASHRGAAA